MRVVKVTFTNERERRGRHDDAGAREARARRAGLYLDDAQTYRTERAMTGGSGRREARTEEGEGDVNRKRMQKKENVRPCVRAVARVISFVYSLVKTNKQTDKHASSSCVRLFFAINS